MEKAPMFHPNMRNRTPSQTRSFVDACARTRRAARDCDVAPESLRPFAHPSDKDVFFEGESSTGEALFFKSHVGSAAELRSWTEPASARWAERAGCGARVHATSVDGVLVTSRLAGGSMTRAHGNDPKFVRQVATSLHRLHSTEPSRRPAKVPCTTGAARDRIGHALRDGLVSEQLHRQILQKADWVDAQFDTHTVTPQRRYGDCHFGNWVLVGDKLHAIDLAEIFAG